MRASVKWVDGRMFIGESGSGHTTVMDGAPENGGRNLGIRPMEMLLIGLGGCTAFDVVHILEKGREPVTGCVVDVEAERAEKDPKVFTHIDLHFKVSGRGLSEQKVVRAIELSREKYCSASIMFAQVAKLTHRWTLVEALESA